MISRPRDSGLVRVVPTGAMSDSAMISLEQMNQDRPRGNFIRRYRHGGDIRPVPKIFIEREYVGDTRYRVDRFTH